MSVEDFNDELPSPPAGAEGGAANTQPIDDEFDPSLLTDVPKMGDAMPMGTYVFRLDSFSERWTTKDNDTGREFLPSEQQPYFSLQWKCQQEPHVGRVVFENVPWVRPEDSRDANNPASPRRAEARSLINKRMPRAKEIMEAASFTPSKEKSFKSFLGDHPELKLTVKVKERQSKGLDGKWHGTGEQGNEVTKHLSLRRPA